MPPNTERLAPENSGARCRHLAPGTSPKPDKWGIPEKSFGPDMAIFNHSGKMESDWAKLQ